MVENGFSHRTGFLWGVLFPWVAALPLLYQPNALNQFINFSSLVFVSFTDFIVPCELPAAFFVVNCSLLRCCHPMAMMTQRANAAACFYFLHVLPTWLAMLAAACDGPTSSLLRLLSFAVPIS